jgi:hypothetical protein
MTVSNLDVCCYSNSGQARVRLDCPLCANSRLVRDLRAEYPPTKNPGNLPGASLFESIERDHLAVAARLCS